MTAFFVLEDEAAQRTGESAVRRQPLVQAGVAKYMATCGDDWVLNSALHVGGVVWVDANQASDQMVGEMRLARLDECSTRLPRAFIQEPLDLAISELVDRHFISCCWRLYDIPFYQSLKGRRRRWTLLGETDCKSGPVYHV